MHHGGGTIAVSRAGERDSMRISWKLIILMMLGVVLLGISSYTLRHLYQHRHSSEGLAKSFKTNENSVRSVPLEENGWKVLTLVLVWAVATVLEVKRIRGTIHSLPPGEAMLRILRRWRIVFATMIIVCAVGVPAIWLLTPQEFRTKAVIRVSLVPRSASEPVLYSPKLDSVLSTAARRLASRRIIDSVAQDLASENLSFSADYL